MFLRTVLEFQGKTEQTRACPDSLRPGPVPFLLTPCTRVADGTTEEPIPVRDE